MQQRYHRGDTIVELVLAFAIFSFAAVGTLTILNNGVAITQRNLEMTLVQQQVDSQAEYLRHIHDTKHPLWSALIAQTNTTEAPAPINTEEETCPANGDGRLARGFFIQPIVATDSTLTTFSRLTVGATTYLLPTTYARIDYRNQRAEGIWVQVARAENQSGNNVQAYDFYIHACWDSTGLSVPMTTGTIVRLYEK